MQIRVHAEEDSEAGNSDRNGDQGEGEAMLQSIREIGNYHGEDERACPWRYAVELRADWRIAISSDNARGEKGVTIGVRFQSAHHLHRELTLLTRKQARLVQST